MFYPIDGRPTLSYSWLGKHKENPKSINQSVNNASWTTPLAKAPDAARMEKDTMALKGAMEKSRARGYDN